ncbi:MULTISPECIES: alpha-amylase family protein [Vibrio]|uniref:alpha-amylase family protein n=1 Tax=Vibrio TaxID=662 RepID=UPI002075ACB2|nr:MULTISPECIES: alpha-amylase family protein [Vibrio]USD35072.1 alpha-amylase family protein [Vibrio sp. SCSIO 43186]USD48138.1 alpha-amylase family protein [Vibrio sp. SCSIO 43145]USD72197.1 alpha-amylase family protein [Vibrio sp. SCSIO 43139]USD97870.1 amylosucrase [Vibrio coralliilyticus]
MLNEKQTQQALQQVLDSVELPKFTKKDEKVFLERLAQHFPSLVGQLHTLYGERYDFFLHLQNLVVVLAKAFSSRKRKWKNLDEKRLKDPAWYRSEKMLGMAVYVDLFAGDLQKLKQKIPYLKSLGVNYLHLMPLYKAPEGDSDGGYAVSDYRKVDPKLGTEKDLAQLAEALSDEGISLVLDFVFNHTSDEHKWAVEARRGNPEFEDFYYFFTDKKEVDEYNQTCREIFPTVRRGSFTFLEDVEKYVWTTFNSFQWDLNYSNPAVFNAITDEMLFLANIGCEGLRLDALAFIWKEKWTQCESLPKAHTLIQCFNTCLQIAAPAVLFKSEAIVHPDEVAQYIDKQECQLSYNPLMMALMWESLATRETKLLTASLKKSFEISDQCSWVNYIRCHDDIGWTFDDAVAEQQGINGYDHRRFLNQFYTGKFEGSFSQGVPFQENPTTGDCRVCGSLASLAGLEKAIDTDDAQAIEHALKRIRLLNSINLSIGGIPLIYQGDELGILNDHSYLNDKFKRDDARWVNRPAISPAAVELAEQKGSYQHRINQELKQMIALRQNHPELGNAKTEILETYRSQLFAYCRTNAKGEQLLALCNFGEMEQTIPASICDILGTRQTKDLLSGKYFLGDEIVLSAYDVLWLKVNA